MRVKVQKKKINREEGKRKKKESENKKQTCFFSTFETLFVCFISDITQTFIFFKTVDFF